MTPEILSDMALKPISGHGISNTLGDGNPQPRGAGIIRIKKNRKLLIRNFLVLR